MIVSLTEAGTTKASEVQQTLHGHSARVLQRIPATERENVSRALDVLHQALQSESAGEPIRIKLEDDL